MARKIKTQEVIERLLKCNASLIDVYKDNTKVQHMFQCNICSNTFMSTPREIFQANKQYGTNCCKVCAAHKVNQGRQNKKTHLSIDAKQVKTNMVLSLKKKAVVQALMDKGIELQEPYKNRNKRMRLKCTHCQNIFDGIPCVVLRNKSKGCSSCSSKKIHHNTSTSCAVKHNKIYEKLKFHGIQLLEPLKSVKQLHKMQCLKCKHTWDATVLSKTQLPAEPHKGCPGCSRRRADDLYGIIRAENIKRINERGFEILSEYDGKMDAHQKILVKNTTCGHVFECTPVNLLSRHVKCGVCGPIKRSEPLTSSSKERSKIWKETASEWDVYKSDVVRLTEANYKQFRTKINPKGVVRGLAGTEGAYQLDHIVSVRYCFERGIPAEVCAHPDNLQMMFWRNNTSTSNSPKMFFPDIFVPYIEDSTKHNKYFNIINARFPESVDTHVIGGISPTAFFQDSNLAIFVIPITKEYGNKKLANRYKEIVGAKTNVMIFFEDEFITKTDIVLNKIAHKTDNNRAEKIHARKCNIRVIDASQKNKFLNTFHIQGKDVCNVSYGAFYEETLIAVMTFSKPRVALGGRNSDALSWELSRFATDTSVRVPGIASKLLTHFQRNHDWKHIYSYADKRISSGNLYDKLGFILTADNKPDYTYVINNKRKHRWNYRKDVLKNILPDFDPSLTEFDNMCKAGLWRMWDCGTFKYSLFNKEKMS